MENIVIPIDQNLEKIKKLRKYEFWQAIGCPKYICSPMASQSELSFRLLVEKYGCDLSYTPMINTNIWKIKKEPFMFKSCQEEKRVVAQLAGDDAELLLQCGKVIQENYPNVIAIDINFGCPQAIAKRGRFGSYLLSDEKLVLNIVKKCSEGLKIPFFVKIRILNDEQKTIELAEKIQNAGASALCVHGRTKEQKGPKQKNADWGVIKKIKEKLVIPVIANGGIYDFEDVEKCFEITNADAVMSAEGLLEYPALFSKNNDIDLDLLVKEYLEIANKGCNKPDIKEIKPHLFKWFHQSLKDYPDLTAQLGKTIDFNEIVSISEQFINKRQNMDKQKKRGWYFRWFKNGYYKNKKGIYTPIEVEPNNNNDKNDKNNNQELKENKQPIINNQKE